MPRIVDDCVLTAAQEIGGFEVIGQDDVQAALGFERQKDLLGCDDTTRLGE